MDEKALICFRKVAELEHMTKAAQELFMSQSQLSRIISDIEAEMGAKLFDRTGRSIKLNTAGKVFYEYVMKISMDYYEAKMAVRSVAFQGMFQVSLGTNVSAYTLDLYSHLSRISPEINIRDISAPRNTLTSMLRDGRIDFAIAAPPINDSTMVTQTLLIERPCVIHPEGHPIQARSEVSIEEIGQDTLIGVPRGYGARDSMNKIFEENDITPRFAVETANTYMVEQYVSRGLGIAVVPKSIALQSEFGKTHYVNVSGNIPCPVGITWVKGKTLTEQQNSFLALCRSFFTDYFDKALEDVDAIERAKALP